MAKSGSVRPKWRVTESWAVGLSPADCPKREPLCGHSLMQSPAEPMHTRPAVSRLSPVRGVADKNESPYRGYRSPRAAIAASGVRSNQARARGLQGGCVCCGAAWDFDPTEEGRNPTLQGVVCRSRFATGGSKIATAHDPDRKHTHLQIAANRPDGCGAGGRAFARPTWGGGWG